MIVHENGNVPSVVSARSDRRRSKIGGYAGHVRDYEERPTDVIAGHPPVSTNKLRTCPVYRGKAADSLR